MHLAPFISTPKQFLAEYREAGMRAAVRYCVAMGILMLLMFLVPSILSGVTGGLLMHVLGLSVTLCIVGVLGAIFFMWAPSRDELVRRKSEPYYEGIHVRRITLVDHFFSVSALRATPPPRAVHR